MSTEMTRAEIEEIAEEVAKTTIREFFRSVGADPDKPLELQKDFAHVRSWRESTDAVKKQSILVLIGLFVSGVAGLVWAAFTARP